MYSYAIVIHNTGLHLLQRNEVYEGMKLLHDALTLVRATLNSSDMNESLMMGIQERYTKALTVLSSSSKDRRTTSTEDVSHQRSFCVVEFHDLRQEDLSRKIMSSNIFVVVRLDEDLHFEENTDMISAVVLQNLASVHSAIDSTAGPIRRRRAMELLLLSRSLQLKMIGSDNYSTNINNGYASCVVEALHLMTITLWRLVDLYASCGDDDAVQQVQNELECVRQKLLHVLSRTEMIFSFSQTCAPCA
jgi:hypothetical protein